ncbi:MAG: methylated-DNA--[protein]-cysteine S-methyltransferase [Candidatus Dependentiae bacterium]
MPSSVHAQVKINSPIGDIYLIASDKGLSGVYHSVQPIPMLDSSDSLLNKQRVILAHASRELTEYFENKRTTFTVPLDIQGTPFQQKVWQSLLEIPYGKTISYKQLAAMVGNPKASRAVGSANGKNPLWIIIPCHRVIAANGTLGGYAGGLAAKKHLLDLEQKVTHS